MAAKSSSFDLSHFVKTHHQIIPFAIAVILSLLLLLSTRNNIRPSFGATNTTGYIPIMDMVNETTYMGETGGLYGNWSNNVPSEHWDKALAASALIQPLDGTGNPDSVNGKIIISTIGMSNTYLESNFFVQKAKKDPQTSSKVDLVNGAQSGKVAQDWAETDAPWNTMISRITAKGYTAQQVQTIWLKEANGTPNGTYPADADRLRGYLKIIATRAKTYFPNLKLMYLSSRIYAGYSDGALNPEPYAYESGFAVRRTILDQIENVGIDYTSTPVLLWGPYLWADGEVPRSDGLTWVMSDFAADGTHPSSQGGDKVAARLLDFFKTNGSSAPWFVAQAAPTATITPPGPTITSGPTVTPSLTPPPGVASPTKTPTRTPRPTRTPTRTPSPNPA